MKRTRFTKEDYPILSMLGQNKCLDDLFVFESNLDQNLLDAMNRIAHCQAEKKEVNSDDRNLILSNEPAVTEWLDNQKEFLAPGCIGVPVVQDALYQVFDKNPLFGAKADSLCSERGLITYYIPHATANLVMELGATLTKKLSGLIADLPTENGILLFDRIGSHDFKRMSMAYSIDSKGISGAKFHTLKGDTVQLSSWFHIEFNSEGVGHYPASTHEMTGDAGLALICLLFIHFFETEKIILTGPAYKTSRPVTEKLNGEAYDSTINYPVHIIDAHWFTTIVRTDPFLVKGHFRKQPFGPGRTQYKIRWISAFQKNGYTRKATHEASATI